MYFIIIWKKKIILKELLIVKKKKFICEISIIILGYWKLGSAEPVQQKNKLPSP